MKAMTASPARHASDTQLIHVYCLCAQWCGTCREYQPVFDTLARQLPAARFVWVDVETHDDLMGDLDIENFPTLLITDAQGHPRFAGTVLPHADTLQRMCQAALAGDFAVIQEASWQSVAKGLMQLPA
jgi:thiol-disulfide isomerase/thioredoxin